MSIELFLLLMAIGLATGTLIGAVGVGGVLLVPALVLLGGLDVHDAIAVRPGYRHVCGATLNRTVDQHVCV